MIISVILAAGEGTRMKSNIPKVVHKICGKAMAEHVIDAANKAGSEKNIVIVGYGKEKVKDELKDDNIEFVSQPIGEDAPYGTGYAVMQAENYISDDDRVIILTGDTPLIERDTLNSLLEHSKKNDLDAVVLTAEFEDPTDYGRIKRKSDGSIESIVEEKDADESTKEIKEINSGIFMFKGDALKYALDSLSNENSQGEYYITDAIKILADNNYKVDGYILNDNMEILGVNSKVQLSEAEEFMRMKINNYHMLNGVSLIDPKTTYIEKEVEIGRDTIIYPGVVLKGKSKIGENCMIQGDTNITDTSIGDRIDIKSSTLIESLVGDDTKIGPYAYLRPKSKLGKNVKIGDFVEVKNANIGDNSKASHLSYIGDADVGESVNIGCGVVFVNYDGKNKFRSKVGDNAFIGSNSNLVAPVVVNDYGYIAAGSTITDEVGEGDLSIARARQVNKPNWVFNKNKRK